MGKRRLIQWAAMPEMNDIQLMARLKRGDTHALEKLIRRYQTPLLNFFRRLGANIDRAEDCAQETFIKLYGYRYKYRPTAKFATFLYTLARHTWIDEYRRQRRSRISHEATENTEHLSELCASVADHKDDRLDIETALGRLSEKLRMTVILNIYQGLNYEEISKVLNIPVGTVKSRMSLAFEALRKVLKDDQ